MLNTFFPMQKIWMSQSLMSGSRKWEMQKTDQGVGIP